MSKDRYPQVVNKRSFDKKYVEKWQEVQNNSLIEKMDGFIGIPISLALSIGSFYYWIYSSEIMDAAQTVHPVLYVISTAFAIMSLTLFGFFAFTFFSKFINPDDETFAKFTGVKKRKRKKFMKQAQEPLIYTKEGNFERFDFILEEKLIKKANNIHEVILIGTAVHHDPTYGWEPLIKGDTKKITCVLDNPEWMEMLVEEKQKFRAKMDEMVQEIEENTKLEEQRQLARKAEKKELENQRKEQEIQSDQEQEIILQVLKNS